MSARRITPYLFEAFIWALIVATAIINLAVYTNVVQSHDAIDRRKQSTSAGGATPVAGATPVSAASKASLAAEADDSESLPGRFVPTQGRQHTAAYPLRQRIPFCPENQVADNCYASNPPTSGMHLPVQGTVRLTDGNTIKIPPDPGLYDFPVPREAIPHIEEHAGVYVGYNCSSDACKAVAERLKNLVNQEVSLGARVVLSPDRDLDDDTIGVASWTRVDTFAASDYTDERLRAFIKAHSCRFDPEQFCKTTPVN